MRNEGLADELVALGLQQGLAAVGIASADVLADTRSTLFDRREQGLHGGMQFTYRNPDRSTDPARIFAGACSLVVGAWGYRCADPAPDSSSGSPKRPIASVARYARRDHYSTLRDALTPIAERLRSDGWRATVVCDDNALVDRAVAHRAGLGWFGKNTLLLLPGMGSWFILGSVVTDAPLLDGGQVAESAPHGDGCGSCSRCITACPTGALVAPGVLDARRCLAWLVQAPGSIPEEFRVALGDRIYGCDECQMACPINRLSDRRLSLSPEAPDSDAGVDVIALLDATDDQLLADHGRWYISHRDPNYLRRNALVVLGNTADGNDDAVERVLRRALADIDPMIVEHATWAAGRLGRDDLIRPAS